MFVFMLAFLVTVLLCRLQDQTDNKFIRSRENAFKEDLRFEGYDRAIAIMRDGGMRIEW
jgi:hypothetical protein